MNLLFAILIVAQQGAGSVSFVDLDAWSVAKSVSIGNGPHEAVAQADASRVALSLYGTKVANHELAIVDAKTHAIVTRIDVGERPHGLAWRAGGVYLTLEKEGAVARVDPQSGAIAWRAKTNGAVSHMLAVTRDEKKLWTANIGSNDVSVIRVGEDAAYAKVAVGEGPEGIALSPDEKEVWVAHRNGGGISIIDAAKDVVTSTIAPKVITARLTFTPDGRKVLAYDFVSKDVIVFDRATRSELGRVSITTGVPINGIAATTMRAFVACAQPDAIVEIDLSTMKVLRTLELEATPDGLAIVK